MPKHEDTFLAAAKHAVSKLHVQELGAGNVEMTSDSRTFVASTFQQVELRIQLQAGGYTINAPTPSAT